MKMLRTLTALGAVTMLAAPVMAANEAKFPIRQLPDSGTVMVIGTIDKIKDDKNFVLKDESGTVDVEVAYNDAPVLMKGDKVIVTGNVDKGLVSKEIDATLITMEK